MNSRSKTSSTRETKQVGDAVVMGVTITKPDKILWPDAGDRKPVTKLDLARYYEAVGSWMIVHLKGRPCSIVRAPDGIYGQHFFQRHAMPGTSSILTLTKVSGSKEPYLQIDRRRRSRGNCPTRRTRTASMELRARKSRRPGATGFRSRSGARCRFRCRN